MGYSFGTTPTSGNMKIPNYGKLSFLISVSAGIAGTLLAHPLNRGTYLQFLQDNFDTLMEFLGRWIGRDTDA